MCFQKKYMHMLDEDLYVGRWWHFNAAFVHRGRQIPHKMKVPCGSFKVLLLYLTSSNLCLTLSLHYTWKGTLVTFLLHYIYVKATSTGYFSFTRKKVILVTIFLRFQILNQSFSVFLARDLL